MEIEVGGGTIELPDGASPEAVKKAIAHYRTTPEFDALIDKKSGSPARVRMLVGSAPQADKLVNLKRFYPDAVPYGDDNFVFTDPATGRPTLHNPPGIDTGDVAGVSREIAQGVGATMGASFGAAGGFVVGAPGGPPGMLATASGGAAMGAGLGSSTAGALFGITVDWLYGREDTRGMGERTIDTSLDFASAAVGQRAGELLGEGVKKALGGGQRAAKAMADAFRSLKIEPPAGAVTGSKLLGTAEKMLEKAPGSADIMQAQASKVMAQTKNAADDVARSFGPVKTAQGAGEVIKEAAKGAAKRFDLRQGEIYDEVFDLIGPDTPVAVKAITALKAEFGNRLSRAPKALAPALQKGIDMLSSIEDDAANAGGIPFQALREVRTMIGRDLNVPLLVGSTGSQNEALKQVYGALTQDMSEAAKTTGAEAAKKLAAADRYTRFFMTTASKTMQKLADFDADDKAFNFALQSARDGGTALARMKRHFLPEEWDVVAGTVLGRMGKAVPNAQGAAGESFSVSTFLTRWNKLAPEAKEALFGGNRYKELIPKLDTLTGVIGSLKEVERATNTSNTAAHMAAWMTLQALGGGLGGLLYGGDAKSALVGAMGTVVAPRVAAKLITSPAFVEWLTTPVTSSAGISAHLGRLSSIAIAQPEIKEEIDQYIAALRTLPTPGKDQGVALPSRP